MQQVNSIREIETAINKNGEMVIGKNNKNNVIVMSMEEYKNNIFDEETVNCLLKSEEDIEKGRTRKATEVIKEFEEKTLSLIWFMEEEIIWIKIKKVTV